MSYKDRLSKNAGRAVGGPNEGQNPRTHDVTEHTGITSLSSTRLLFMR